MLMSLIMMVNDQFGRWGVMGEQNNRSAVVKQKQIFDVLIDWYPPEKGGRRQIPQRGIYYCTTEILNKYKTDTWSIALKMNEISQHEAEMWFFLIMMNGMYILGSCLFCWKVRSVLVTS